MKIYFIIIGLCLSSLCWAQQLYDSLIVHYSFANGQALDESGNGLDGFVYATPCPDRFGNVNSAIHFNGVNEYIDFPNDSILKPQYPISFAIWINFESTQGNKTCVFSNDYAIDQYTGIFMNHTNLHIGDCGLTSPDNRSTYFYSSSNATNTWLIIVGVFNGLHDMHLYYNCEEVPADYEGSGDSLCYTNSPGAIGRVDYTYASPSYFQGTIDEFWMWHRALNGNDVNKLCHLTEKEEIQYKQSCMIYPNPAGNVIYLSEYNNLDRVVIYDMIGNEILSAIPSESINIETLKPGVYLVYLYSENRTEIKKIIKQL